MSHADEYQSEPTVGTPGSGERVSCRPLVIAVTSTTSFFSMVEIVGGALTNSLAMLAEAGHLVVTARNDDVACAVYQGGLAAKSLPSRMR